MKVHPPRPPGERRPILLSDVRLEGEHVLLRPVRRADARVAFPLIHGRREVLDWLVWQGPVDLEELEEAYSHWVTPSDEGTDYQLALVDRRTGRFCGTLGLRYVGHRWVGDLGYWLAAEVWGRGLGTEACFLAAYLAFRHLSSSVLTAQVFVGNDASARVLEKNGFRREDAVRTLPVTGETTRLDRDQWIFTLTRARFGEFHGPRRPLAERVRHAD